MEVQAKRTQLVNKTLYSCLIENTCPQQYQCPGHKTAQTSRRQHPLASDLETEGEQDGLMCCTSHTG